VRVNYTDCYGKAKQLTRTAYGAEKAKDLEQHLIKEIKDKEEPPNKNITIQQLYDEYEAAKKLESRETTISRNERDYRLYIKPTFEKTRLSKITVASLQKWKLEIGCKMLAPTTKKNIYSVFRAILNFAVRMEYASQNPIKKIGNFKDTSTIKKDMQIYTANEFKRYINVVRQFAMEQQQKNRSMFEWDFYVFFSIAFFTGLRKGEIIALKWSDITGLHLSVRRSISQKLKGADRETPPKNKTSVRTLHIPLPLQQVLLEHKKRQKRLENFSDDYRICGGERCIRTETIRDKNKRYAEMAGLNEITVHSFRHSHVSVLANEHINIQEIARRLGHARIEETWNTYSHMYPREEERAVSILNEIMVA
jgi:integrase